MDRTDAVKNVAMYYAMMIKYSRDTPSTVHDQMIDYFDSDEKIPVGLIPFKDNIIQLKKCIQAYEMYVMPIPEEMREDVESQFEDIGEEKFVEWFREQKYKEFTSIEDESKQEELI
jgi:hypothetical protein